MSPKAAFTAILAAVLASALALPAAAETAKKKKRIAKHQTVAAAQAGKYRGANLFPAGPLYGAGVYLGDDPDPFIRLQLQRDLSGRLGGDP